MEELEKYKEQDIENPTYLFHGSPYQINSLEPRKSLDSRNKENEDEAVFLTSCFNTAAAYAFRNRLKEINEYYNFIMNNNGKSPAMIFRAENILTDLYGYIYVFNISDDIIKDKHSGTTQYRCYHELYPVDVVKVYYKDFANNFAKLMIESDRIYYTQMTECLVDEYLKMYNNPEIQKSLYGQKKEFTKEQMEGWVQRCLSKNKPIFSMIEKGTNDFIGIAEIPDIKDNIGEIAISVTPGKQGKGYGKEAIQTIINYGSEKMNLDGFELYVYKANQRAISCYQNVGFQIDWEGYTTDDVHMSRRK